jgi:hypothetical protein
MNTFNPRRSKRNATSEKIELELARLNKLLGLGQKLEVRWLPGYAKYSSGRQLSGEVLDDIVYIYEEDIDSALTTLKHEIIEKWVSDDLIVPYKHLINALVSAFEEDVRRRRERAIKKLCDLLDLDRDKHDADR